MRTRHHPLVIGVGTVFRAALLLALLIAAPAVSAQDLTAAIEERLDLAAASAAENGGAAIELTELRQFYVEREFKPVWIDAGGVNASARAAYATLARAEEDGLEPLDYAVPAIGERLKVYQLARFYRTIGMLLRGGTPLVAALDMGGELLHPLLRERLARASQAIREGRGVAQSMDANGLTTPVALRMLAVGEKSGNMGEMLEQIAAFHDEEMARWVDWFTRLFEPILMAIIGLVIGVIVILMYMPIFELAGNLQ